MNPKIVGIAIENIVSFVKMKLYRKKGKSTLCQWQFGICIGGPVMCFHKWIEIESVEEKRITKRQKYAVLESNGMLRTSKCIKCGRTIKKWKKFYYIGGNWVMVPNPQTHHLKFPPEK